MFRLSFFHVDDIITAKERVVSISGPWRPTRSDKVWISDCFSKGFMPLCVLWLAVCSWHFPNELRSVKKLWTVLIFGFLCKGTLQDVYWWRSMFSCCLHLNYLQEVEPHLKRLCTMEPRTRTHEKNENLTKAESLPGNDKWWRIVSFSHFCPLWDFLNPHKNDSMYSKYSCRFQ